MSLLKPRPPLWAFHASGPFPSISGQPQPTHLPEHERFDFAGGDRAHRAGVLAPAARPEADVVAVEPTAPARVGSASSPRRSRCSASDHRSGAGIRARASLPRRLALVAKDLVHSVPDRPVGDRLVLTRVALAPYGLAEIGAVAQDLVQRALIEWPTFSERARRILQDFVRWP